MMCEGAYRVSDLRRDLPIGLRGKICFPRTCMIKSARVEGYQGDELVKKVQRRAERRERG